MTPQRLLVKKKNQAFVLFYNNDDDGWFVTISGGADWSLGNEKSNTTCWKLSEGFGIADNTLTGKPSGRPNFHQCSRLVAIWFV